MRGFGLGGGCGHIASDSEIPPWRAPLREQAGFARARQLFLKNPPSQACPPFRPLADRGGFFYPPPITSSWDMCAPSVPRPLAMRASVGRLSALILGKGGAWWGGPIPWHSGRVPGVDGRMAIIHPPVRWASVPVEGGGAWWGGPIPWHSGRVPGVGAFGLGNAPESITRV